MVAWWYSKANKIWLRVLTLVVSSVFFFTQVVGASVPDRSFWRERRKSRQKLLASREKPHQSDSWSSEAGLRVKKLEEKDVAGEVSSLITPHNLFTVPSQYGTVKEIHTQGSSKRPQGMGNRLIIHIQDAHSSPEAQLNSANILKYLQKGVARESTLPLLICVEGSSGLVDTTLLSSFPEKKVKEEVANEFLKEGKITGEEYFAIAGHEEAPVVNIYGVEDKRTYEKNLKAFDEGLSSGERLRNYFQKIEEEINPLKARLYNKRLKELELKIEAYQKKKISLTEYSQYLDGLLKENVGASRRARPKDGTVNGARPADGGSPFRVTESKYPNFKLFVEASKFEKKIDFSRVDSERTKYIKELSKKLTNDELSDLLIMSLDYRLGKVTSAEYYTYLQSLSSRMGKGMRSEDPRILTELVTSKEGKNEYPNLNLYIKYNKLYDRIAQNKLFSEISELEQELKERLCEREEERDLVKLSRMLSVLQDLTSLKISNEDLAYYYKHRDDITPGMFSNFINTNSVGATFMAPEITANLSKFEEFYRIALKRNEALVNNTISRMEKEGVKVTVLIAGGFHTPGITELLRDRNISYVVVTPRLGEEHSSDLKLSPRKKRTDLEKAIAGIVGALRPASILREQSFQTYSVIQLNGRTLILYSQFEPAAIERAFEQIRKNWESELGVRAELREVVENVDFFPEVLIRDKKAFALGVARGKNGRSLPFVFRYDAVQKKVSEVIFGEDDCRKFLFSGSFDNAGEAGSVAFGKLRELWPFLVKDISLPESVDSKRTVSMKPTPAEVLGRTSAPSRRTFLNAAFGNIGWWLHRRTGGLNDLIKNLFAEGQDVTKEEEFAGEKSANAIKKRFSEFIGKLQYDDLSIFQKWTLKLKELVGNGIWDKDDFEWKKQYLIDRLSIYYLDSGKNLFWVKGKYAAAHYGRSGINEYVSARYAKRASPDQLFEIGTHEGLHILGFSHRQALRIARRIARKYKYKISYGAKELMDELTKEDKKEDVRTSLLHDKFGRFTHHKGKRPEDAKFVIALSNLWEKEWFTLPEYGQAYKVVGSMLGFESLAVNWEQTARGDLQKLVEADFLTIDEKEKPYKYQVTPEGKTKCLEIRASLLEEDMGGPLSRASILREARSNPSANRARLLERLNAFIDSEIPLEYKRADLRRRLREERARGLEFDISGKCSAPIVRDEMKYWIDEYFLGVDLLELVPGHKHYARVDILREEIVHKLAHSLRDIDTSTLDGLQELFIEETWATMGELGVEIEVGDEGRKAMLAEFEEWAKSHGVDLDSKIGWRPIESAGYIASKPNLWSHRGGFSLEGIDFVGAELVLNVFEEFTRLTKLTTRRPLYEEIYTEREKPRIEALFHKRRKDLITFLSRISGSGEASIEGEIVAFSKLKRESIHHIYETFIEEKVAIVDQGGLFRGLDVTTSLKLLNLLSLYARCEKAELIEINKGHFDVPYVRNCIRSIPETQVLATGINQVEKKTIDVLSELATIHRKVAITNTVNMDYKNATSEGIETDGLTPEDLEVQASLIDSETVKERLRSSVVNGFLSWVRNVSARTEQIETVADDLREYKDIIFLGAPALAEAIIHSQGIKTEDPRIPEGRRIHFVNNFEGTRFQAMERLPDFSWHKTYVVVVSQGAGDSIQKENLKFLKNKVGTKIAVVANFRNPLLKEAPEEHTLITTDIRDNEGVVNFSGVALALAMSLAGLDYKGFVNRVEEVIKDNTEGSVGLPGSAAARFAGIIRGLGLKENHKGELVRTIMMLSYDKAAQYIINAATLSSNQRLAALRTYFGSLATEANHNDFQIAMGRNGTLMVLISPDKWPTSQVIPPSAKPRWASTPESQYNTADFMDISKKGIQTELTEFSDHNIGIIYKPDLEGLADLVGLIQVASEIDYSVSLECGEINGKEQDQARSIISKFDRDFKGALITKRTSRPSSEITMSDNMTKIDLSGLMGEKESLLSKDELPDALAAVAKNKLTAQRSHHIGGQHIHLDEPHQAATKDEIKKSLDLISLAAEDKKNFIVVGVGGPHNDPKFGVQPLRGFYADELTDKKVLFGGYTLDPTLMKELIDAVDKDPYGTMIMYISSSGETAEPDNTYHILLEHLMKKSKELNLNESAAKQRLAKEAGRIGKNPNTFIAKMEGFAQRQGLTLAQYEFVRDHILIITSKRGYLNFEASARGFRRPAHPLSSGRHAIYTLTLYMMKALGMDTDAFIKGGQAYVKDMFLASALLSAGDKKKLQKNAKEIETKSGDVQDELIKLAVKDINKALEREGKMESGCGVTPPDHRISNMLNKEGQLEISSLEDFRKVVNILTEEKWEVEEIESLLDVLREKDRNGQKEKAISQLKPFLQRDPGFLAGALMGYIGRHKGRFRVKFVDLTQLLGRAGKWRDKHLFNEGLNKPHISTIAESMETQDILSLLPALADDKESIVVLCEDTNPEDPLKAQKLALSETVKSFLRDHGIPFVVLGSRFNERAHATHILAMMQLNSGYGCTIADPPHGYSPDLQVYGEEKCGKARVAVDVAGDKDRGKEPTGIDDIIEQFTLDEKLIGIIKTSMTMGQRFFDIIKGKDIIKFWGRPNAQADELVEAASNSIMEALESENILRDSVHSIITIHPITKAPKIERDLNKNGKYVVWVIPADNLIEGFNPLSPGGNPGSIIVISEVDHPGKPISEQSLNLDNTRMIIEFIHGPSDEPGVMVWGRREMFGHTETAVYSYLKVGDILIPRILKAGSHFTSVPEKKGTDAFNICDTQVDLPPTVAKIWNNARDTEVRSRDFRSPVGNIAKTVNGGISEFTTTLLEATIHSIFAAGMGADTIIIDKDGNFFEGKQELSSKGIRVADIEPDSLGAFQKVMFTTGDPAWMSDLRIALGTAQGAGRKDDNKPRKLPDPIWVPDGSLVIPKNQPKLTDFLKKKRFDPDLIRLVNLWTRISVEFGQEYKKTTTLKPMGTANIAGEVQYVADMVADKRYHDEVFEVLKNLLFASISEERSVTLYTKDGKYISFCDPVDGVKNLLQGFVTGNIEAITLKDGSDGVSMHFLQGSNILIFEDGENTYCTIWDGNDFRVMYKYEFGKPVPWAIKNIAVGGAEGQYGATNPDARTLVDELVTQKGYYSDNATGMLIDIAHILERSLPRSFDRELKPRGENLGIYDIVSLKETVVGGLLRSGGFLYLDMATARPDPEIVDQGAKMRLTELVALCKEMERVEGLGYHFGTNKSLQRIIIAHHDPNLPKLAYPCFLGVDDDVLKEINRFMWRRYVEQGFASKMQAETPFEKYDVAKDEEGYEQALDIDSEGRVYRLKKNPHVGMVRFKEPEGWRSYPVHGRVEHLDVDAIFPAHTSEKKPTAYEGKRPEDKDAGRFTGTAPLFGLGIVLGLLVAIVKKWTYLVGLAKAFTSTKAASLIQVFDLTKVETIKDNSRELIPDTINEVSRTFWDRPVSPLQVIVICAIIIFVGILPIVVKLITDRNYRNKIFGLFSTKDARPTEKQLFAEVDEETRKKTGDRIVSRPIIDMNNKGEMFVNLKREHLFLNSDDPSKWTDAMIKEQITYAMDQLGIPEEEYERKNTEGLGLIAWFLNYFKEANVSTAGIRGVQNIKYPWDTRYMLNFVGIMLATWAKAQVAKKKHEGKPIYKLTSREVRYNSKDYAELIARVQAANGITTLLANEVPVSVWLSSMKIFKDDMYGGEYVTSSHAISKKTATKDLNDQGSQYLVEESLEFVEEIKKLFIKIYKEGEVSIKIAPANSPLIKRYTRRDLKLDIDMYVDYLKKGVATLTNINLIKKAKKKIFIDITGGSMYHLMKRIFKKLRVFGKFGWFHTREDPFFYGIGKGYIYDPSKQKLAFNDFSCDVSVMVKNKEKAVKDILPLIDSPEFKEALRDKAPETVVGVKIPQKTVETPIDNLERLLKRYHVDGVEVYMPKHRGTDIIKLRQMIERLNKLDSYYKSNKIEMTTGSDGRGIRTTDLVYGKKGKQKEKGKGAIIEEAEVTRRQYFENPKLRKQLSNELLGNFNDESLDIRECLIAAYVLVDLPRITGDDSRDVEIRLKALSLIKENMKYFERTDELKGMEDLHYKSFRSDGEDTPAFIILNAWLKSLDTVGVVDNHTFSSHMEAIRAGEILGDINVKTGIEFDFRVDNLGITFGHLVAYFPNEGSAAYQRMLSEIEKSSWYKAIADRKAWHQEKIRRRVRNFNKKYSKQGFTLDADDLELLPDYGNWHSLGYLLYQKYGSKLRVDDYHEAAIKYFRDPEASRPKETHPDKIASKHGEDFFSFDLESLLQFIHSFNGTTMIPHSADPRFGDHSEESYLFEVGQQESLGIADYYAKPEAMLKYFVVGRVELAKKRISDPNDPDVYTVDLGNGKVFVIETNRTILPVVETMGYRKLLKNRPIGTVVMYTDPDGDRLITMQIEDMNNREKLEKLGIAYMKLDDKRILAVYTPNQSFLMTMDYQMRALKKAGLWDNHPRFIIKTTPSAMAWDEWAKANGIKVVNVPVGFKEIANVMRKVEKQIEEHPDKPVIIEDVYGQEINLGIQPRLVFAGEESGGEIFGPEDLIESRMGRKAISMREKSAGEALVLTSALSAYMEETGKTLSKYLEEIYNQPNPDREDISIVGKYDVRVDAVLYNESEPDINKLLAEKAEGERKRTENDIFYLSIALAIRQGKITHEQGRNILQEAFPDLDFSNLKRILFVGDGTYLEFENKYVEIRPSGTDAKTKGYSCGDNFEECGKFADRIAYYSGERTPLHKKLIPDEYFKIIKTKEGEELYRVKKIARDLYDEFYKKGRPTEPFNPPDNYDHLSSEAKEDKKLIAGQRGEIVHVTKRAFPEGVEAVVFDMEGTVIDTELIIRQCFVDKLYCEILGLAKTGKNVKAGEEYYDEHVRGKSEADVIPLLIEQERSSQPDRKFLKPSDYLRRFEEERENRTKDILERDPESLLKPGAKELISMLKQRSIRVFLVTFNTVERAHSIWQKIPLFASFDDKRIANSTEEKILAIRKILEEQNIPLQKSIFIDDAPSVIERAREILGDKIYIIALAASDALVTRLSEAKADAVTKSLASLIDEIREDQALEGIDVDQMIEGLKSGNPDVRLETVRKIMALDPELREKVLVHFASLPLSGKTIFDAAKKIGSPVPAWNIDNRGVSCLQIEPLMRAALDNDALVIFEVGPGALLTYPPKGPQLPQYCAEVARMLYEKTGKEVTYTPHLDHLQIPKGDYKKNREAAIQKAVDCVLKWIRDGGMSAAVDTSTLTNTDVKREGFDSDEEYLFERLKDVIETASIILAKIYELADELGVNIGIEGEVGDVGKELSTSEEAMYYYVEIRKKLIAVGKRLGIDFSKVPWMDVMAIQAGTAHGYDIDENDRLVPYAGGEITVKDYQEKKKGYVFERIIEIVKSFWEKLKIWIAIALHGFSGTPIAVAEKLAGKGVAKTNINTDLQSITWKVLQAYNPKLYRRCYELARDAASKELEKLMKKEEQEEDPKEKEKLQKKINDLQEVLSLPFEKSKNRIIYGKWGAPGLRKLFRASEENPKGWKFLEEIERALRDDKTVRMRLIEDMTDQELREYGLDDLIDEQAREEYLEECFYKLELPCVPAKSNDPKGLTALEAIHKLTYDRGAALTKAFKLQGSALKARHVNRLRDLRLQQWQLDDIRTALEQARTRTSQKGKKSSTKPGKSPEDAKKVITLVKSIDIRWPSGERVTPADIEKHNITELVIDDTGGRCVSNLGEFHITKTTDKDKDGKPYYLMVPGSIAPNADTRPSTIVGGKISTWKIGEEGVGIRLPDGTEIQANDSKELAKALQDKVELFKRGVKFGFSHIRFVHTINITHGLRPIWINFSNLGRITSYLTRFLRSDFFESLGVCGLISPSEKAEEFINAIIEAQCPRLGGEIAFRGDREQVLKLIRQASQKAGKVIIAAGTVLNGEDAIDAVKSGASLIVTPGLTLTKFDIERIHRLGAKVVVGVGSKEEAREAKKRGADAIKAFPFNPKGDYIKALKGPTPKKYHTALDKHVEMVEEGDYPLGTFKNVLMFLRNKPNRKQKFRLPSSGETLVKEIKNAVLDVPILITGGVSVEMIEEGLLSDLGVSAALSIKGTEMIPRLTKALSHPSPVGSARKFGKDVNFLKKTLGANNVVVLSDKSGKAQLVVVPAYQGRVMTSSADGLGGLSFGWINQEQIKKMVRGQIDPHINVVGGEDRFWMGPEGGQFSLFFPKGASPEFKFEDWQTPAVIDTEAFDIVIKSQNSVTFQKQTHLTNYSGTESNIKIDRTVRLLGRKEVKKNLRLERLPKSLKVVAYESDNGITNTGEKAWTKDNGLLSIWILGMFNPSPDTTIVIPFKPGLKEKLGKIVNDAYFGEVPADRLVIGDNVLFFRGDGQHRSKIGLSPRRAKPILGSYDAANKVLTLVQYTKPRGAKDYVNSMWEIQEDPYAGDVVNSYNDGPVEPGGKPLGPFYELETSSPGKELKPNESIYHVHRTIHLQGPEKDLDKITRQTLGVTLEGIKNAFRGKGSPLQAAKVLIKLRDEGITEVSRKEFIKYRNEFSNRTVDYEIKGLRLAGLIDHDKGIVRLTEEYKDITEEELDKMNEAAQEIISKGLDRWRLDDIPTKDISMIKKKLASIVRERKILFAIRSFLDSSDPHMSITNLRTLLARVYDSETLGRIIKGARGYAVHLQSESIWSHLGVGSDEITLEDIGRARKDDKAIRDKLKEVISALTDRIRKLRGHKAKSQVSPQELVQTTGLPTTRLASLPSFVSVIVAVILGWASTGAAKDIVKNIPIEVPEVLGQLGKGTTIEVIYPILAALGIGIFVGVLVSIIFDASERRAVAEGKYSIKWPILAITVGSAVLVVLTGSLTLTHLVGLLFGYPFGSLIMYLIHRHQLKEKQVLNAIVDEFKDNELEHIIEQIKKPTFRGKVTRQNAPVLYGLLERLKSILDEKGVRNNLPEKFQRKNKIGGLFMLKKALGESPEDSKTKRRKWLRKMREFRKRGLGKRGLPLVLLGPGILLSKDSIMGPISDLRASIGVRKQMIIFGLFILASLILAMGSNAIASWVKNWWANRGKVDSDTTSSEKTDTKDSDKSKKGPSTRFMSILLGGLGILLLINSDVFGAVGEIVKDGQQAGLGIGLGLWGVLICTVAVIGARAVYQQVGLAGTGLVEVGRVRLPQVLGLEGRPWKVAPTRVRQALVRLFEGGRGFVAAIFRQPSKRAQLRMSWLGPREELSQEKITEIMELARRLLVKEGFYQENPEIISPLLGWTSLPEQMAGEVGRIEKFVKMVRRRYERVVVIGEEARLYTEVAATIGERRGYPEISVLESTHPEAVREKMESEINPEETLFVVSSPEPVEYLYKKLTEFYKAQGIPAGEIASQVGKHFVAITEINTPFAKKAGEKKFLRTFNVPEGISGSSAIFSEGALFILALAGVDIKGFVESGREGMEMCREERPEKNLAIRLAAFQEVMRQAGRQIVLVLPEELGGFGEVWQGMISPLGKEAKEIIVIGEEELAAGRRFGEKTAFILLKVGREKESLAIEQLREAGYPVFEITVPGEEAIGELFYVAGFATALSYLMEISPTRKGIESSLVRQDSEEASDSFGAEAALERIGEPLSEYPVRPEVVKYKGTKVFVFDFESLFDIEFVREATPSRMGIELKVKPKSKGVFKVMEKIVKAAEEVENLDGVKFAFVSSRRDVTREIMEQMLKDYMSAYGLSADVVAGVIDNNFIINERELREAGGIVGKPRIPKISTKAVFSLINEKLLLTGRTDGNGTEIKVITHSMDRWRKDGKREMMERILWVLLKPAGEGEVLSTAAGLVVAIEGKVSKWLREFIKSRYPGEEAERLLSQIQKGNTIILPATPVDEEYLKGIEAQEKVYRVQA